MINKDYIKGQEDVVNYIKEKLSKMLDDYHNNPKNVDLLLDIINLLRTLEPGKINNEN